MPPPGVGILESLRKFEADPVPDAGNQVPRHAEGHGAQYDHEGPEHERDHRLPPSSTAWCRRATRPPRVGWTGAPVLVPHEGPRKMSADPFIVFSTGTRQTRIVAQADRRPRPKGDALKSSPRSVPRPVGASSF